MNYIAINDQIVSLRQEIKSAEYNLTQSERQLKQLQEARYFVVESIKILTVILSLTQEEIIQFIEEVVSFSLQHVYGQEYSFKVEFDLKRNQPEINMVPYKGNLPLDPKYSCGVGVVDVVSFALRLACLAILNPAPDQVLILDEPTRNLHGSGENERFGLLIQELSKRYGLQIIIVSGESILTNYADKAFFHCTDSEKTHLCLHTR